MAGCRGGVYPHAVICRCGIVGFGGGVYWLAGVVGGGVIRETNGGAGGECK